MKTKQELAHEVVLQSSSLIGSLDIKQIVTKAWEYEDLMYEEVEKREPQDSHKVLKDTNVDNNNTNDRQPDWSQAPSGFDWWARDGFSNKAHWYNKEPFIDCEDEEYPNEWNQIENSYTYIDAPLFNYQGDWKDSLRKRP